LHLRARQNIDEEKKLKITVENKRHVVQNKNGKKFDGGFSTDINSSRDTRKTHFLSIEQSKT
jgi:hypothetical protein